VQIVIDEISKCIKIHVAWKKGLDNEFLNRQRTTDFAKIVLDDISQTVQKHFCSKNRFIELTCKLAKDCWLWVQIALDDISQTE